MVSKKIFEQEISEATIAYDGSHSCLQSETLINITHIDGCMAWRNVTGLFKSLKGDRVIKVGVKGYADIIGVYKGTPIAIECKIGKDKLKAEQRKFRDNFTRCGGVHITARTPEFTKDSILRLLTT